MNTELWRQIREVFHAAVDLSAEERESYLNTACPDPAMRREVESLLKSHEDADGLLEVPALKLSIDAPKTDADDPWIGESIGAYQVISKIGQGGMGTVYRAMRIDEHYVKQVAIKLVRTGYGSDHYLRRFKNERQIMASLDHPNIARLLDGGTAKGSPYFVMEYIEGKRIDEYCDSLKLNTRDRLKLFLKVCSAVQYAHQHLVVHRDLKPGNILITAEGVPKLLDFGIAKLLEPELFLQTTALTMTQMKPMTPEFASPEQVRGEAVTTASDVYSLGVLLYRLLTGHSPYAIEGRPIHEVARAISETEPLRPSLAINRITEETGADGQSLKLTPEIVSQTREGQPDTLRDRLEGDLDNILLKALRKEPDRRYASVEQFADDLQRHIDGLPVLARKDTIRYRTVKFVRRHRMGVAASVLIAFSLVGGIVTTAWQARIARAERAKAEQRFNDVRELASSLIFDLDDAINQLPGSTPARKLLVSKAMKYLDTLSREARGELGLQRELAGAYQKLGNVQGNPFHANLGDTGAALESYKKVLALRQAIAAADPNSLKDQFALGIGYRLVGQMQVTTGDLQTGMTNAVKALTIMEQVTRSDPGNLDYLDELQNMYELIGDIQGGNGLSANLGDTVSAVENHRKALAIAEDILKKHPDNTTARRGVPLYHIKVADDLVKLGDRVTALEYYKKALKDYEGLAAGKVSTLYTREINLLYTRIGDVQLMNGDARDALENYRAAMKLADELAAADPANALAREDIATGLALLGKATAEAGNAKQGLVSIQKAVTLMEQEVAKDPKHSDHRRILGLLYVWRGEILENARNLEGALADFKRTAALMEPIIAAAPNDADAKVTLAAANTKVAETLSLQGKHAAALAIYEGARAITEPLAHTVPPNSQAQYAVADIYSGMGDAFQRQALRKSAPASKQIEQWNQARSWYERSFAEWKQVRSPGKLSPIGYSTAGPGGVAEKLAQCDAELGKLKAVQ